MPTFAEQLKNLIGNAAVAAAMFDTDMRYLAWSQRWLFDLRLSKHDLTGQSHYEIFPEISEEWKAVHWRCLAGATEARDGEPFLRLNGETDYLSWSVQPWYTEQNQVGGLIITTAVATGQKRAEEALATFERRFSSIFRESPVAMALSDCNAGRILDANGAMLDMLGATTRDQVVGKTSVSIGMLKAEDRARLAETAEALGSVGGFNVEMRRVDGTGFLAELWVSSYVEGGARFLLTSIIDVTDRKRVEEELLASRTRYRALFEAANDAVCLQRVLPGGTLDKFVAVNSVAVERLGYSAEELQMMTSADIDASDRADDGRRAVEQLAVEGNATFEMVHVAKDGHSIPVEISARQLVLGGEAYILSIARDMTARKRAEEEIARLAAGIEQAVETVVITDNESRIVYANPAFEKSTGYQVTEVLGKNPRLLKSGKHDAAFYREMWDVLGRGETWRGRLQNKRKDGTLYLEDASISPVRDKSGQIVNYIALKLDVTHEAELQAQLLQAQKMESIGRLAGGVAHDFNNLLTVINGYSDLAMAGLGSSDPLLGMLEEIHKAGERAAGLTRQLLAYSRKQILQPRVLDVNDVVEEMKKMLERLMGEDVELRFSLSSDAPTVNADPHQLQQVIMNLAVNARDAMPDGGRLTIETAVVEPDDGCASVHPELPAGGCAVLSVSDTGTGMDEATRQRIFEPFFTTKGTGQGTGLGLSIVQGVIAQSGGCVRTWSEPGEGTTFKIYLPLVQQVASAREAEAVRPVLSGSETILVVEDQEAVREFVVRALQTYGYHVLEAAGGDEALAIYQRSSEPIHLLLTDMVMPRTSGCELATRLSEIRPDMKAVFMSGYSGGIPTRSQSAQVHGSFIAKPFSPEELAAKVRSVLGPARSAARIVVADDETEVRSFIRTALESVDYQVSEAANGAQAMQHILSGPVDLLITDLVMPEQEGIETIRTLRHQFPNIGIIATSGAFDGQFLGIATMLGANAVLSKPFSPEALLAKVGEVLSKGRTARSTESLL